MGDEGDDVLWPWNRPLDGRCIFSLANLVWRCACAFVQWWKAMTMYWASSGLDSFVWLMVSASSASSFPIDAASQQASMVMMSNSSQAHCSLVHALVASWNGCFVHSFIQMSSRPRRVSICERNSRSVTSSHVSNGFGGIINLAIALYFSRVECKVFPRLLTSLDICCHDL